VLARRGLPLSPDDEARIESCSDLAALERWHDAAVDEVGAAVELGVVEGLAFLDGSPAR
jgi:hypothetical protein